PSDGKTKGRIEYTAWSEVFSCAACAGEIIFLEAAFDEATSSMSKNLPCPHCGALAPKEHLDLIFETWMDGKYNPIKRPKRKPVSIRYSIGKNIYNKKPDIADLETISRIHAMSLPENLPISDLPDMQMGRVG